MASEDKPISQFPTAVSILMTTLLFGSVVDQTSSSGYDSVKILVSDLAEAILGDFQYTQDLDTDVKTIFGAINGIRVLSGTTTPNNADGANRQLYVKHDNSYDVTGLYVKLNSAWHEISTGGGGGGASVDMGTTVPSDASGSNGDLYVQYDGTSYDFVDLFVKINGSWRKAPYSRVVALTQSEYAQITPDPTTLYIITDAQSSYQTKSDNSLATSNKTVVGAINEVNTALSNKADSSNVYTKTQVDNALSGKADKGVSNSVTGTLDVAMNSNAFITYRTAQNILIVTAVFNANSAVANNTQIAHISGVSQIGQTFVSSNGDKGTAGRFKMQNGNIINEFAMPASEYFSLTFVSFI